MACFEEDDFDFLESTAQPVDDEEAPEKDESDTGD